MTIYETILILLIFVPITVFIVYLILVDYFTYHRLNKYADELIRDQSMDRKEWELNIRWEYRNCRMFSIQSILWRKQYENLCDKLMSALEHGGLYNGETNI